MRSHILENSLPSSRGSDFPLKNVQRVTPPASRFKKKLAPPLPWILRLHAMFNECKTCNFLSWIQVLSFSFNVIFIILLYDNVRALFLFLLIKLFDFLEQCIQAKALIELRVNHCFVYLISFLSPQGKWKYNVIIVISSVIIMIIVKRNLTLFPGWKPKKQLVTAQITTETLLINHFSSL